MEVAEKTLILFVGSDIKAGFPVFESVLVDQGVERPQALAAGISLRREVPAEAVVSEIGACHFPVGVSIGSICITGALPDSAEAIASLIRGIAANAASPSSPSA